MPFPRRIAVFSLALSVSVAAIKAQSPVTPVTPAPEAMSAPDLMLGPGDLIDLRVFGVPDLNATTRIGSNGDASLPLIGVTHIAGLTLEQAQTVVTKKYVAGGFLRDPQVSILIREFTNQGVSVLGEVQRPGFYPIVHAEHLMAAISAAGGLSPRAGKTIIITHRDQSVPPRTVHLSFNANALQEQSEINLQAGDTVNVGRAGIVYVAGDVNKPGGFVLDNSESISVLQAVALAAGTRNTASLDKARLIRTTQTGREDIPVPLKEIVSTKKPDMPMLPDDILFIPNSTGKTVARQSLQTIVQIATGLLIYHPY